MRSALKFENGLDSSIQPDAAKVHDVLETTRAEVGVEDRK